MLVRGDQLAHERDDLRREQRIQRGVVEPERCPLPQGDVLETRSPEFGEEGSFGHGTGDAAGPGGLRPEDPGWEVVIHSEVGDAEPATRSKYTADLRECPALAGGQVEYPVGDDDVDAAVGQRDRLHLPLEELGPRVDARLVGVKLG